MADSWQLIETAPKDGSAFLAYGRHIDANVSRAGVHWKAGDHWWAIILWDVWRKRKVATWVFSKDGQDTWSEPTHWQPLPGPPSMKHEELVETANLLVEAVSIFAVKMDTLMKAPASHSRGQDIARLLGDLESGAAEATSVLAKVKDEGHG